MEIKVNVLELVVALGFMHSSILEEPEEETEEEEEGEEC